MPRPVLLLSVLLTVVAAAMVLPGCVRNIERELADRIRAAAESHATIRNAIPAVGKRPVEVARLGEEASMLDVFQPSGVTPDPDLFSRFPSGTPVAYWLLGQDRQTDDVLIAGIIETADGCVYFEAITPVD